MLCLSCECETYVIDDHATGDSVCTNCGTVVSQNCMYKETFDDSTRTGLLTNQSLVRRITSICEKYSIPIENNNMIETCEDWLQSNHHLIETNRSTSTTTEYISCHKIRVGVCVMYLYCQSSNHSPVSITRIREWSSRLSVKDELVSCFLTKLRVFNTTNNKEEISNKLAYTTTANTTATHSGVSSFKQEWVASLQKKCFDILTDVFGVISIERKNAFQIKKECSNIIHKKSKSSIIGVEYLSGCVVKHLFQKDLQNVDNIVISSLRLNRNKFLSTYRMLYK
jgi:transcription initiation factor TFIIIB Brf1 subunit/transcription initiation factor TFIIB